MEVQSWLCSSCGRTQAITFCLCEAAGVLLCQNCFINHFTKSLGRSHPAHPIQAYPYKVIPGYFERLNQRSTAVPLACEELRKNIQVIDKCITELSDKAESVITVLRELVRTETEKMVKLKAEMQKNIELAISEVDRTLYEEQPNLCSKYGLLLRTCQGNLTPLSLFKYQVNTVDPHTVLQLVYSERCSLSSEQDIPGHIVPQIYGNTLRRYNLFTGQTSTATLATSFTQGAVFCLLNEDLVLCAGGHPAVNTAYCLELSTAKVISQQPMRTARCLPGIIKHGSFSYVFGGNNPPINACEKFSIPNRAWTALPDMQYERWTFTPCLFGNDIYLPDAREAHKVLEIFNVTTEQFKTLAVPLPNFQIYSVSFIIDGELIIISHNGQMGKWLINAEQNIRVTQINLNSVVALSSIPPMRNGRQVIWAQYTSGNLGKFDLDSQTISS